MEKVLIGKIKKLRQIKPRSSWVSSTKMEILGQEPGFNFFPYLKPALAGLIAVCVLFGPLGYTLVKNSLPGDLLYQVRRIAHKSQAFFVSEAEKPAYQLKLANDRLEDLVKAPAKNLAPTINEFQANIFEAVRDLAYIDATTSDPLAIKKIVEETKKLEENTEKIKSLGVAINEDETEAVYEAVYKATAVYLIEYLEDRTLTEEKEEILAQMKELFEKGEYSGALEIYLINQ